MWPNLAKIRRMADPLPMVLLGGTVALELAPRLEASGYATHPLLPLEEPEREESPPPAAVILASGLEGHIPSLRRRWGSLPILLGSPQDDVEGRCRALGSGADDLWLSSAGPSDLLTRLRLHLHLQRQPSPSVNDQPIVVGDLEVHPSTQTVRRAGQSIALTAREFELLLLLLQRSPKVVSREVILKEIWPEERTTTSNVIEVYVRYLRRKLETGGHSRLIQTVRGMGYALRQA
jgi:two-component system, OmpR family, response regulator MprA